MITIIKKSISEYIANIFQLLIAASLWITLSLLVTVLTYVFSEGLDGWVVSIVLAAIDLAFQGMIAFDGLRYLYNARGVEISFTQKKIVVYIFSMVYIGLVSSLGLILLVVPGLVILAACFFVPLYILKDDQGPIEAVASSATLLQGRVFHITLLFCGIWLAIYACEYVIGLVFSYLPLPYILNEITVSFLLIAIGLVTLPMMVNLRNHLEYDHNNSMQPTPSATAD